ncbi:histidine--tRNA ligase [Peptoniphilus sp. KCTC 25270]|uniref:histidine--tRNA ligase n=1 Tax=Peptoniphilus sp. KCTC 25270 TaxID=2897414 RepID=UPI001E49D4D5|nr:histidine--tRNA ligase [Peptoniphilus sp. KCTC 25270]MCD1147161.1 histidine--tRNA ligase [Peptoniphilus sp. KCTC 25270]
MTKIVKPSTLPGFMELLPEDQLVFNQMMDTIRENYEAKGFLPIDTPVLEKEEVLLAKGGGETEKQIYAFQKGDTNLAMRFDLTVPLARYVAEHFSDLNFPFRRYHIGKVYRGERAQKGRFREFYQCDIDIIGNGKLALFNDGEIPSIIEQTFLDLGFDDFTIHMNNRKILSGFYGSIGVENTQDVLRIIDKLDKIGWEKVAEELEKIELSKEAIEKIRGFISIQGSNDEILEQLSNLKIENEQFVLGLSELNEVLHVARSLGVEERHIQLDLSIARGLDYYTGTVYETILNQYPSIGSVCSGGRYENLAEYYTKQSLPGVGISIGLSRLYYQLNEAGILEEMKTSSADAIVIPMDDTMDESLSVLKALRDGNVRTIFYGEKAKLAKKFKYADQLNIPYAIVVGRDEIEKNEYKIRNMETGEEEILPLENIAEWIREQ